MSHTTEDADTADPIAAARKEAIRRGIEMTHLVGRRKEARQRAAQRDPLAADLPIASDEELAIIQAGQEAVAANIRDAFACAARGLADWVQQITPVLQRMQYLLGGPLPLRGQRQADLQRQMLREARERARRSTQRQRRRRRAR